MKKAILLFIMFLTGSLVLYSQVPQAMTYKAIAKDDWGVALPSKAITLRFTILEGSEFGLPVYVEVHSTVTNKFGLMDVQIGKGIPSLGSFSGINWSTGIYYIKIEMDPKGGSDFRLEDPAHQLLSVPYALYAGNSGNAFSGNYNDLYNRPTNLSQFNNNMGFISNETDPVFSTSPAHGITSGNISNWNAAFGWGTHAGLYKPLSYVPKWAEVIGNPFSLTSPIAEQLLKYNGVSNMWENWTPNYLTTEVDGSVTNELQTLNIEGNTLSISDGNSITLPIQTITGQYYYADKDNDGYGDRFSPVWVPNGVAAPANFISELSDCNDNDPAIHPEATEIIGDGIDNNCNGLIDENNQCLEISQFPFMFSGEFTNGPDQFCFRLPNITFGGLCTINIVTGLGSFYYGIYAYANGSLIASQEIGPKLSFLVGTGKDYMVIVRNRLNHLGYYESGPFTINIAYETDDDGDGYTISQGDCNDNDPTINPGATEICDGKDNDCDGQVDEPPISNCASPPHMTFTGCNTGMCQFSCLPGWWDLDGDQSNGCESPIPPPPIATSATNISANWFQANWSTVYGGQSYFLDVSTDITFSTLVVGFDNLEVGNEDKYNVTGLIPGMTYYYRIRSNYHSFQSVNSNIISLTTPFAFGIGDDYQGGKIAYILQPGDPGYITGETHGLIAAPSDQSKGAPWGCDWTMISGADGTALGTGMQNTIDIINGCPEAGIAAKLCSDLVLSGYSDWYLPSKDELTKLYISRDAIGGLSPSYWSSTESSRIAAWALYFGDGGWPSVNKYNMVYVRAIRSF